MTKKKHPQSRAERLKYKLEYERQTKKEREGRVRRKLQREETKAQETEDELREARI